MDKRTQSINEWIESTKAAEAVLRSWRDWLQCWKQRAARTGNGEYCPDNFNEALRELRDAGLDRWADTNPCGGGLDLLAAAVRGETLPETEPVTFDSMLTAIFGGGK